MLQQLYIKNVALINEELIEFDKGLNILSGETGAGKSIVIGSLSFVLGARATKDFIKKGEDFAMVEALLTLKSETIKNEIRELGVDMDEDSCVLISRTFNKSGRNICKVNGRPATLGMIKEICEKLIDIHGQHEHQSLLNPAKHILLLDRFCEDDLLEHKTNLLNLIKEYKQVLKQISDLSMGKDREDLIDFFNYQISEIENAKLSENEENILLEERKILSEAERLKSLYTESLALLYSDEDLSALDKIGVALNNIQTISSIDNEKKYIYDDLQDIYAKLEEIIRDLKKYDDNIDYNEDRLNEIENRLDLIQKLKRKYGSNIKEVLLFKDEIKIKLDNLINSEEKILKLYEKKEYIEKQIKQSCINISNIRKEKAKYLEKNIEKHLFDLGMQNSKFKIDIKTKDTFNQNGFDKVEFLICTNLGEDVKPLSKIASGGEMSRVMLSLKAVLSFVDTIDTFIFDEIDSGISGRTAQMVAEKMSLLSKNNQIICITHLPQIAAMGDQHFLINKSSDDKNTKTSIERLKDDEIVNEIARMTGGATITDFTLASSNEMIQQAKKIKESM
ncbi:DNA repair protein RecN [[Clostridium] colinum]|uniref:DNA repair protein RecN n=1 Tax=[Clostridium] colinum TaxID=36835 RepID=UPI0020248C12|nr:DNA repair protein RecN [[Clostridium] colinum]